MNYHSIFQSLRDMSSSGHHKNLRSSESLGGSLLTFLAILHVEYKTHYETCKQWLISGKQPAIFLRWHRFLWLFLVKHHRCLFSCSPTRATNRGCKSLKKSIIYQGPPRIHQQKEIAEDDKKTQRTNLSDEESWRNSFSHLQLELAKD